MASNHVEPIYLRKIIDEGLVYTQKEAGDKLGISNQTVSRAIVENKWKPYYEQAAQLLYERMVQNNPKKSRRVFLLSVSADDADRLTSVLKGFGVDSIKDITEIME